MIDNFKKQNSPGKMVQPTGKRMINTTVSLPGRKSDFFYSEKRCGGDVINDAPGAGVINGGNKTQYPKSQSKSLSFKDSPKVK